MSYSDDSSESSYSDSTMNDNRINELYSSDEESSIIIGSDDDFNGSSTDDDSSYLIESYNHYSYIDDEIEYRIERIFHEESDFIDKDKENGKYYIGLHKYNSYRKLFILTNGVSAASFLKFPYMDTLRYLYFYSILRIQNPKIEILSLSILPDDSYSVILKTYWLRIIQRNWKRVFKERTKIYLKRRLPNSLYSLQISGRYPVGLNSMPSIYGMLCNLRR
jgi:hypothetical protein